MRPSLSPHGMEPVFVSWSVSHWAALALILSATAALLIGGHRLDTTGRRRLCNALAALIVAELLAEYTCRFLSPEYGPWRDNLPLHFCTFMQLMSAVALRYRRHYACAGVFFCVLTASIQALITPALKADWPSIVYVFFFLSHGLLLAAALAIPLLADWRARRWDPLFCVLLGDVYILFIHPINLLLDTNYGFTRMSPAGSMLDYLGPAPWYFLLLQLPALALFSLLYLTVREKTRP